MGGCQKGGGFRVGKMGEEINRYKLPATKRVSHGTIIHGIKIWSIIL